MHSKHVVLVTGGLGFVGSHLIRLLLNSPSMWRVVNVDLETYAANAANLADVGDDPRYRFVHGDIADDLLIASVFTQERITHVINCAAETHVDRSIESDTPFLHTNVLGTQVVLDAARAARVERFVQVSSDEVYGTLGDDDPPFTEQTALSPRSPYSASKAAGDMLALAAFHTHDLDVVVTRSANNYGPGQHPEKLIPFMITAALQGRPLPVYGDGKQKRDWIHVLDHCHGIIAALEKGRAGQVYNFGANAEHTNISVVRRVLTLLGLNDAVIEHVTDRPGHDRRYAINSAHANHTLAWAPLHSFDQGLVDTVAWYAAHTEWWHESAERAHRWSDARVRAWSKR